MSTLALALMLAFAAGAAGGAIAANLIVRRALRGSARRVSNEVQRLAAGNRFFRGA